jgi:lipopolysaccharide export system permease protein
VVAIFKNKNKKLDKLMKILTQYLTKTLVTYVLLVMFFLFGIQVFIEFINEFPRLGIGNYGLMQVLNYVILMLPNDIYQFFPMACLLGFIIALGLLSSHSELIVMRASGLSMLNIVFVVNKVSIFLLLIMIVLGEVVSPMAQYKASRMRASAMSGGKVLLTKQGVWLYHKGQVTNINAVRDNKLSDVTTYHFENNTKLHRVSHANFATYNNDGWTFNDVAETNFKDTGTTSNKFSKRKSDLKFSPKLVGVGELDTDQKNLFQLYDYIQYREETGADADRYLFIFWQRLFAPLSVIVMTLLAIPFVFGVLRNATLGLRMLVGLLLGFAFYMLHQFVGPMSIVYHVSPIIASLLPLLIFAMLGMVLLYKGR